MYLYTKNITLLHVKSDKLDWGGVYFVSTADNEAEKDG